ncbi:PP2C family protein-serine/threonine phosphatase [Phocaeicola salanitronis]|uniref:PP2C family protein-serine/threonine phosphatase n=1 Tax=Phocaeicola salanitronis TaxID=376805 RepID=UPI00320B9964
MIQINTSMPFVGFIDSRQGGRKENQDSCGYVDTALGLLIVVCDGMGGGPGGKLASSLAVEAIIQSIQVCDPSVSRIEAVQQAVQQANRLLYIKVKENPHLKGMGTTAVLLLINEYSAVVAHVGDSRCYLFRGGRKVFRSFDHSLVFEMVKNKTLTEEQARLSSQSNVITRALGIQPEVEAEVAELAYEKGDRFMLCTDGIWGVFPEKMIVQIASQTKSPAGAVESLVIKVDEQGFASGGTHDNLTVTLIETTSNSIKKEKMSTKTRNILIGLSALCCISLAGNVIQLIQVPQGKTVVDESKVDQEYMDSVLDRRMKDALGKMEADFREKLDIINKKVEEKNFEELEKYVDESKHKMEIIDQLDKIIAQLEELKKMKEGTEKNKKLSQTKEEFEVLAPSLKEYGITENEKVTGVVSWLSNSIAQKDTDKSQGHYIAIIKKIDEYKDKIRKSE